MQFRHIANLYPMQCVIKLKLESMYQITVLHGMARENTLLQKVGNDKCIWGNLGSQTT